jgi:glycosyltransferase involved in cell wall biosynthesis
MRIIVNAISANTGGIVTYTTNLIDYLSRENVEAIVYVPSGFRAANAAAGGTVTVRPLNKRFFSPVHRFLWEQIGWRRIVKESGADVVFSSANYGILFPPIPQVLLVQGEIYLNPVYREKVLPRLSWRERLSAFLRRHLMLWSARCSRETIFPSQVALDAAGDYDAELVDTASVNYLGVNPRFKLDSGRRAWCADGSIRLLYVSVYYPHKDPVTLAEATRRLNEQGLKTHTRITMEPDDFHAWDNAGIELRTLRDSSYTGILEMGRIDHAALDGALRDYDAFVFPSMAETFGFPMVEAMQAGVPLIVSDISIHREICGDAALYFRLGDPDDLAACVRRLHESPELRTDLVERGHARAHGLFTWEQHVAGLMSVVRSIVTHTHHRVMINALHARTGGGVTYLRNMLPLMAADARLDIHICLHEDQLEVLPTGVDNVTYHYQRYPRGFWRVLIREQFDLPRLARRIAADSTFSPANYGPFWARNHVVMARNAVRVGFVERRPLKLAYWAMLYAATFISFLGCRRVIAVSEYAKRGVNRAFFGVFEDRIEIIPHGVEQMFLDSEQVDRSEGFLLAVSDIYVQKNFTSLVRAFAKIRTEFPDLKLRIAGRAVDDDYFARLQELIRSLGQEDHIEFLGHVGATELRTLYLKCGIFVFPSTVETFGNPLVEAMACGAPIASSNTAAMPEVLGDAASFFNPNDVDEIAGTIRTLLGSEEMRADLSRRARVRAKHYSWANTARRTIDAILGKDAE